MTKYAYLLILLSLAGCKKSEPEAVDLQEAYAGIVPGRFVVYDAFEVFHDDPSNIHDTSRYLLKTVIGESFQDESGEMAFKFNRYKSNNNGATWNLTDVWVAKYNTARFELIEENVRKVQLIFPPRKGERWDLNVYNVKEKEEVKYDLVHENILYKNSVYFDSTLTYSKPTLFSLVDYRLLNATYAKNIGLINYRFKDLTINNFDTLDVRKGTELMLEYRLHGFE